MGEVTHKKHKRNAFTDVVMRELDSHSSKQNYRVMTLTEVNTLCRLEIMAKTVIPGYNVVGTSKYILGQAGRLSRQPFIAFKMRT